MEGAFLLAKNPSKPVFSSHSLIGDSAGRPTGALFTNSYGLGHPSRAWTLLPSTTDSLFSRRGARRLALSLIAPKREAIHLPGGRAPAEA